MSANCQRPLPQIHEMQNLPITKRPFAMTFDVASCRTAAEAAHLGDWVRLYLQGGPWANEGLSAGLLRQARCWTGPVLLRLNAMERCCGPEPGMEYRVDANSWSRKVSSLAGQFADPAQLPPLILQWRARRLSIRDGNHRHAAARLIGWTTCWAVVWHDDPADNDAVMQALVRAELATQGT